VGHGSTRLALVGIRFVTAGGRHCRTITTCTMTDVTTLLKRHHENVRALPTGSISLADLTPAVPRS
jgi:hypothetical protein